MNKRIAPLGRLMRVWVAASLGSLALTITYRAFTSDQSYIRSPYFGGFLFMEAVAIGLTLSLLFHAFGAIYPLFQTWLPRLENRNWIRIPVIVVMMAFSFITFVSFYQPYSTFDGCGMAIIDLLALRCSWETSEATQARVALAEFRRSFVGRQSLLSYLVTWVIAVLTSIICSSLSFVVQFHTGNLSLWLGMLLLTLLFNVSVGLVCGYFLYSLASWFTFRFFDDERITAKVSAIIAFRVLEFAIGLVVIGYVSSNAAIEPEIIWIWTVSVSSLAWLVTFKRVNEASVTH